MRWSKRGQRTRLVTPLFIRVQLSTFAYFLAVGALQPTLPRYVEGPLHRTSFYVGLAVGIFALSAVMLRPLAGRLSDSHGRRLMMVAGAAVVAVSILFYTVATTLVSLLVLRLITGVGEAFFYTGAASVINDLAPDERRGEALSYFSLALFLGLALGPLVGESALGHGHYAGAWIAAAAAAALASLLGLGLPDTRPDDPAVTGESTSRIIHPAALVPGAVLGASVWGLATFTAFVPLYALKLGLGGSRFVFLTYSVFVMSVRSIGARIPDRFGASRTAPTALTVAAFGLSVMALWQNPLGLFTGTAIFAIGHSLAFPALMAMAIGSAPPSERGAVVGTFTAFFDLSFGVGALSAGFVADHLGYEGAFLGAALVAIGGLFLLTAQARKTRAREAVLAAAD